MEITYKTFNSKARVDLILNAQATILAGFDQVHMLGGVKHVTPVQNLTTKLFDLHVTLNTDATFTIQEVTVFTIHGEYGEMREICELYNHPKIKRGAASRAYSLLMKDDSRYTRIHEFYHNHPEAYGNTDSFPELRALYDAVEMEENRLKDAAEVEYKEAYAAAKTELINWLKTTGWELE